MKEKNGKGILLLGTLTGAENPEKEGEGMDCRDMPRRHVIFQGQGQAHSMLGRLGTIIGDAKLPTKDRVIADSKIDCRPKVTLVY